MEVTVVLTPLISTTSNIVNILQIRISVFTAATILRRHLGVRRDEMEKLYPFKKCLSIFCKIRQDFSTFSKRNSNKKMSKKKI